MIKLGYNVIVHSWENDADARHYVIASMPSLNEVQQVVSLLKHLKHKNLMNLCDGECWEEILEAALEHGYDEDQFYELMTDLGLVSEYYSVRYVEKIEVMYVKALDYEVLEI
jgi:hypothetical protein